MKNFIARMLLNLRIILLPWYWISNCATCREWDKRLNKMLDNPEFEYVSEHRIELNGQLIWISNYPYAYGERLIKMQYLWNTTGLLPSRKTRIRLKRAVNKFMLEVE